MEYKIGLYQAYLFCEALVQSTKCYSLSLSNHAPFNLLETRQKRLRHVNVIFSPRVVKTPVQDQKFGTNSLDKTVYEIMQIEVHVRASWLSSEVWDCIRHYSRRQSRKRWCDARTEPSIPSSSMNFLPFISHKTYLSAGTDAIKASLTVVPQGESSNAYFPSAIIKLFLQLFT